ncbi:MAG: nitrous oxide-stimulated promoter family protein [Asgard group archaeon]|nr:nitrous oxide-stimulated promoter family protein [Asgard group archaeon]
MNAKQKILSSNSSEPKIIQREKKMVDAMILIYCKDNHGYFSAPCTKCSGLGDYAKKRLESCRFQEKKPVCGRCGLACYNHENRDFAESVFNYAGPRMMFEHPLLGLQHLLDGFRNNYQLTK